MPDCESGSAEPTLEATKRETLLPAHKLFARCALERDCDVWTTFLERYSTALAAGVRRAVRSTLRQPLDAALLEDLVQECYCHLLEHRRRRLLAFRGTTDAEARTWLSKLAARLTRDRLRRARAVKRGGRCAHVPLSAVSGSRTASDGSPERRLVAREQVRGVLRSWRELVATERELLILRLVYLEGLTTREVLRVLATPTTACAIDTFLHRFRKRLASRKLPTPSRSGARSRSALAA